MCRPKEEEDGKTKWQRESKGICMADKSTTTVTLESNATGSQFIATAGEFSLVLDRGENTGPRSIELLLLALGSCTIGTLSTYMSRKGLPTDALRVELSGKLDPAANRYGSIEMILHLDPGIPAEQRSVLLAVARSCRIHKTLEHRPEMRIELAGESAKGWGNAA